MTQPRYPFDVSSASDTYEFESVGIHGVILKLVTFRLIAALGIYNLAFGDKILSARSDGTIVTTLNDTAESRNGDIEKVIATVVACVYHYTRRHPQRAILFSGSDQRRTRGYRRAITRHYEELQADFHIFGVVRKEAGLDLLSFDSKTAFDGFLVYRKTSEAMKEGVVEEGQDATYGKKHTDPPAVMVPAYNDADVGAVAVNPALDMYSGQILFPNQYAKTLEMGMKIRNWEVLHEAIRQEQAKREE